MPKFTPTEWDEIRKKFRNSIMADTSLNSLAQSVDAGDWPVPGDEEKPSKYIDFNYEELLLLPEIAGNAARAEHLISILKETLAFDDPFGDMVTHVEESSAKENPVLKTLGRLGIPEGYPLGLVNVSEATRAVCVSEGARTIGEFANLAQQMSTRVVIGGDFRALLNALSHGDEAGIGQFLPFRKGSSGLHLPEALGLLPAVAGLSRDEQVALALATGMKNPSGGPPPPMSAASRSQLEGRVRVALEATLAWFKDGQQEMIGSLNAGASLERMLVVINDPVREHLAAHYFLPAVKDQLAAPTTPVRKEGFFSRLFGRR